MKERHHPSKMPVLRGSCSMTIAQWYEYRDGAEIQRFVPIFWEIPAPTGKVIETSLGPIHVHHRALGFCMEDFDYMDEQGRIRRTMTWAQLRLTAPERLLA